MRILVVEDNFIAGLELQDRLAALGHRVVGPLADIPEILALIASDPPDAALLDFRVRDATSIPIAEALLSQARPFVFVTGYGIPPGLPVELVEHTRISKPIDDAMLQRVVSELDSLCNRARA